MKTIICFTASLLMFASIAFSQSMIDYQTSTGIVVETGADICADTVIINGVYSGGGTICGSAFYVLNLTAFIEGFYNSASDKMINDSIKIYIINAINPNHIIDSSKSKLDSSGVGTFYFTNVLNGDLYYIVLKHRNSIETWSSSVNYFSSNSLTYDFSTANTQAYGNNQIQVDASPIRFAIFSGDVNQDGIVDLADASLIDNDSYNFVSGYVATDLNGDNAVDLSDAAISDNNAFNFVSVKRP